jgi:hypothetical protein
MKPINSSFYIYSKIPKFTKEPFFFLYKQLLYELTDQLLCARRNKIKSLSKPNSPFTIIPSNPSVSWESIAYSLHKHDTSYNSSYSYLSIAYIKHYIIKKILPKILSVSNDIKHSWDYVIRIHLRACKYEIEKIKRKKDNNNSNSNNNTIQRETVPDFDDEDNSKKKKNIVHLFVGNFDLKKFFDNEQLIKTKESEFCKTFIFSTVSKREHKHKSHTTQRSLQHTLNTKTINKTKRNNVKLGKCTINQQKLPIKLQKKGNKVMLNDSIELKTRNSTNECVNSCEYNSNSYHQRRLFTIQHYNSNEQHNWSLNPYYNNNRNKSTLSTCRNNTVQGQRLYTVGNEGKMNYPIQFPILGNNNSKFKKQRTLLLNTHFNNKNYFTKHDLYYGE